MAIPLQAFDSAEVPKIRSTPEELVRVTKPITLATAKAVAAGNSCRQDDVIVAANVGRKAISDMLTVCKVSNQSFDDLDAVDPPPPKKKKKKALLVEPFSPGHCNVPDYSTRTPPQSRATDTRRYCATLVETERERENERKEGQELSLLFVFATQGAAYGAETDEYRIQTMQAGRQTAVQYRVLLELVLRVLARPNPATTLENKNKFAAVSFEIAQCVTTLAGMAEVLKGEPPVLYRLYT